MQPQLPWTDLHYRGLDRLADNLPTSLLLIDPQRGNADDMAYAIIQRSLCLAPSSRPCGNCKSCHLLKQDTHPDTKTYLEPCKIDLIREISDSIQTTPAIGDLRIIYLGMIDRYNPNALSALLKTLEEPPQHTHFILSAANRRAVKATILSRSHTVTLPYPHIEQAETWLIKNHDFIPEQAQASLNLYNGDPHQALAHPDAPDPLAHIDLLIAYLSHPQQATAYLNYLDTLGEKNLNNYLQNQLQAIIAYRQLDSSTQNWHNHLRKYEADLQTIDLNRLHSLYARISALRRPDRQQIGQNLNIKALLLEIYDKRNLQL
ncbi:MAG: DNA polymerase III subunit delta' [Cardiobacteriaceae bacterium]|nr:DNA polymerase III subunit delta' [Cardiobacteriaceae bacterium]